MTYVLVRLDGLYIFDDDINNFKLKELSFDIKELIDIESRKLPDKIKELIKDDYIFIGQKFENYRYTDDVKIIRKALEKVKDRYNNELLLNLLKEKISNSVSKDELIIQAIRFLDNLNKSINLIVEMFREWYGLYFPEISQNIEDHEKFVKTILNKKREDLIKEYNIKITMGGKIFDEADYNILNNIGSHLYNLYTLRKNIEDYIEKLMKEYAPNLSEIATPNIGARLIALAGGLKDLSSLPSSTIQILGAEKALFMHLTKKAKPPKHGVIFNHPYLQKLPQKARGAMARTLASKISIAARADINKDIIYDKLKAELDRRYEQLKNRK
ncbi:putative NOP5 family protein [Nanobdella aerobiophila]|uniref:NOP5 family protein n=1 Tax=Nanobdella aerobiophila TaxID=2586965 RepID=A0A915SKB5_9ARCH|nr:NOP5/NOP56 family protein [Nanobdella aerobiophila]BBL45211.1 putative NOP5 family protein [Nanobdella aerobiophila]